MQKIVDGDKRSPYEIAEDGGLLMSGEINIKEIVKEVIQENKATVEKIKKGKAKGPVMFLVG